jgi:hypothetical protein
LDYALFLHGLIPEKVTVVTSVTGKRHKRFETPVGVFVYRRVPADGFHLGMTRVEQGPVAYLMASPERALMDKIRDHRSGSICSQKEMAKYLFEDLRVDPALFQEMDGTLLEAVTMATGCRKGVWAVKLLFALQRRTP